MTVDVIRISLHLLAASVWVGGQIVLAGLVGTVRRLDDAAPRSVARAFARIAWPAYGLLFVTGIWNLLAVANLDLVLFAVKFLVVLASGAGTLAHTFARGNKAVLAVGGAVGSLGAVAALVLGVALRYA